MKPCAQLLLRKSTLVFLLDLAKFQLQLLSSKAGLPATPSVLIDQFLDWHNLCK
jgi:hypothetical protein